MAFKAFLGFICASFPVPLKLSAARRTTKLPPQNAALLAAEFCEPPQVFPPKRDFFRQEKIAGNARVDLYLKSKLYAFP